MVRKERVVAGVTAVSVGVEDFVVIQALKMVATAKAVTAEPVASVGSEVRTVPTELKADSILGTINRIIHGITLIRHD
jgi:hypothetical protein